MDHMLITVDAQVCARTQGGDDELNSVRVHVQTTYDAYMYETKC